MFQYYFRLGIASLRRNPALTGLMILTLAVGIAASVSTLTILHVMSGDPIPQKSERLFIPLIDNEPLEGYNPADPGFRDQMSYRDVVQLAAHVPGERNTPIYPIRAPIEQARADLPVIATQGLAVGHSFFAMFDAPFLYGQAWSEVDDKRGADVVVLSQTLAETLFGAVNPVGRRVRMLGHDFQISGVLKIWRVTPRFYRLYDKGSAFDDAEDFQIPFNTAIRHETETAGGTSCFEQREPGWKAMLDSECTWIRLWVETRSASGRSDVQAYLDTYAIEQRKLGRLKRRAPNELLDVMQWLRHEHVVANDARLSAWLALSFLLLCLINTVGLLLAKFSTRSVEVGVRRALGASRRDIFQQCLIEAGVIGLAGGAGGLALAWGALALIGMQSSDMQRAAHMDWQMLLLTFAMSVGAALVAGLVPTWRACQVTPALQLKSQ